MILRENTHAFRDIKKLVVDVVVVVVVVYK